MPTSSTAPGQPVVWQCSSDGLTPGLLAALDAATRTHVTQGGRALCVVSGKRTLRRQAELMAALSDAQLDAMYGRQGKPDYVRRIQERRGAGLPTGPDEVYEILCTRNEGTISAHLAGAAVDIATDAEPGVEALRAVLEAHGFECLDERALGIPCLHATHTASPRIMVVA